MGRDQSAQKPPTQPTEEEANFPVKNQNSSSYTLNTQYMTPANFLYATATNAPSYSYSSLYLPTTAATGAAAAATSSSYVPAAHNPTMAEEDSDYTFFVAQHGGEALPSAIHDARRANRQLYHYFDPVKYKSQQEQLANPSPANPQQDTKTQRKKPTKKELEQFRRRKEERKKIRHRWLYE